MFDVWIFSHFMQSTCLNDKKIIFSNVIFPFYDHTYSNVLFYSICCNGHACWFAELVELILCCHAKAICQLIGKIRGVDLVLLLSLGKPWSTTMLFPTDTLRSIGKTMWRLGLISLHGRPGEEMVLTFSIYNWFVVIHFCLFIWLLCSCDASLSIFQQDSRRQLKFFPGPQLGHFVQLYVARP